MTDHRPHTVERHGDVVVVGASPAGLAAARELGLRHRSVLVLDAGDPADAPGPASTGHPVRPDDVRRLGVEVLAARPLRVSPDGSGVRIELTGGHSVVARRAVLAADATGEPVAAPGLDGPVAATLVRTVRPEDDGARVGAAVDAELVDDDARADARPSAHETDWDRRYGDEPMWSGNPNGTLVVELGGASPGRALDVGCGEGGDAVWLAEQGWEVTASDISTRALARAEAEAGRRGLRLTCRHEDANTPGAFGRGGYDLVTALYASIPRTAEDLAVANLLDAVAPGGTLLVVSHDLAPMRAPVDTRATSRPFDPDAYVRVEDVVAALAGSPSWTIEVHETRPRPPGAATASHHVDDVVLRARRLEG